MLRVRGQVASLRLKLIREGQEDYEYLRLAERAAGRPAVLAAMAPVMVTATNYTEEALDIYDTRTALAALIGDEAIHLRSGSSH